MINIERKSDRKFLALWLVWIFFNGMILLFWGSYDAFYIPQMENRNFGELSDGQFKLVKKHFSTIPYVFPFSNRVVKTNEYNFEKHAYEIVDKRVFFGIQYYDFTEMVMYSLVPLVVFVFIKLFIGRNNMPHLYPIQKE